MKSHIPADWASVLASETEQLYFLRLTEFLARERAAEQVFPPPHLVFHAMELTPYRDVRVVILGQDPYHDDGQAHGLSFSVRPGIQLPPSLRNIFKELAADVGCTIPQHGLLEHWAQQGVLMLNAVLTVRAHEANSHKGKGWEHFTDAVIRKVNQKTEPVVFVLWGDYARKKEEWIDTSRHVVISSPHPSPLSARRGFFGSRPFSRINAELRKRNRGEIDWRIPCEGFRQLELF